MNGQCRRAASGAITTAGASAMALAIGLLLTSSFMSERVLAQRGGGAGRGGGPPRSARESAQFDPTGYWAAVVGDDWYIRMVTPSKGDYRGLPLNAEGRKVADAWNLDADKAAGQACKPFGAAGLMRLPGRLHITWEDDSTLRIDFDAGTQTRYLRFGNAAPAASEPSWQGTSVASWFKQPQSRSFGHPDPAKPGPGSLKVVTTGLRPGYLRKNGAPYSEKTTMTEYFDHGSDFGIEWLLVTTTVEDPQYLTRTYVTSTQFRKEPDGSKFAPTPCEIDPPLVASPPVRSPA